jgi:primosomal protein N' (replication factor Y)
MNASQPSLFDEEVQQGTFCEVVIELSTRSLDRVLTYSVPEELSDLIQVGSYVCVPLGRQTACAYVVGLTETPPAFATKPVIEKVLDEDPLSESDVDLARWLADRYRAPFAAALKCLLPPGSSRKTERILQLTPRGQEPGAVKTLSSAPSQQVVLRLLQQKDGVSVRQVAKTLGAGKDVASRVSSAVAALRRKGLVIETSRLRRPAASDKMQQFACLAPGERDWQEVISGLQRRSPRRAEVIATLLAAEGEPVRSSELPREPLKALVKLGLVQVQSERLLRTPTGVSLSCGSSTSLKPNPAQQAALDQVRAALDRREPASFLLHGVTGSGKTEVYLQTIDAALSLGRSAIVLVPEISLTPQTVGRFQSRFGARLALLHSALGPGERHDEWERIRRGDADIVVGARSAIFAPCHDLGVIVVDEEHEGAYKQDSEPRYAAAEVAAQRARREGAVLLLGSATPMVETYFAASTPPETLPASCDSDGLPLRLVELPERIDSRPLPPVELVDLRDEPRGRDDGTFSRPLLEALQECIAAGQQAILFLNRRGFSTFVMCRECGFSLRCPDCAVSLTYHHRTRRMRCHHCDYERAVPDQCDNCKGYDIGFHGLGTERVADQVERLVEGAIVARMDRDTTGRKGAYADILGTFAAGNANVLVGTQMIAKGHDFPNVTLVGVLNADTGLNRPDFRAAERTFQVLTQVSGRAGRADKPGRVIVQTYNPDHYAIAAAAHHDYAAFYQRELDSRRVNMYPPYVSLIKIGFTDTDEERALTTARRCAVLLQELGLAHKKGAVHFLGPAEAPLHKLRGQWRYHMLVKGPDVASVRQVVDTALERLGDTGDTVVSVDIDPTDMM